VIRIAVGTVDGVHVLGARVSRQLAGHEIRGLAYDRAGWWAILDRRHVHVRPHGGRWRRAASLDHAAEARDVHALCLLPRAAEAFVGTSGAHLFAVRASVVERVGSFEDAPGRADWFTPWGGPPDARSLAGASDGTIYANVHVGGILRSEDAGSSWTPTIEVDCDAHEVACVPGDARRLFAATAVGLGVTADRGATWRFETRGLHATYQRAVAISRDYVLVSTSRSERGAEAAVYRRPLDGSAPLTKCVEGLPRWFDDNVNTSCLAARGETAAIATRDGRLFVSSDQGKGWRQVGKGLPRVLCVQILER